MKTVLLSPLMVVLTHQILFGQALPHESRGFLSAGGFYVGDVVNNLSGGIQSGTVCLGIAGIQIGFETEPAGLWSGGQFTIRCANTHGSMPSRNYTGNFQAVSNIEAGNHTFFQELWLKQTLGTLQCIIGIQDVNSEFACSRSGSLFLNSSFGITPTISSNIPASLYPLTSPGLTLIWSSSDQTILRAAVYDGSPAAFEQNPYSRAWDIRSEDGVIHIVEGEFCPESGTSFKVGAYHHDHLFAFQESKKELIYEHNTGIYGSADIRILSKQEGSPEVYLFSQAGFTSRLINQNYWYGGIGIRAANIFSCPEEDELGLAAAHAGMRSIEDETIIEVTYKRPLNPLVFLQADIQYTMHPAGVSTRLQNSLVGIIRCGFSY